MSLTIANEFHIEKDPLGEVEVPAEHLWYAQRRSDLLSFFKLAWSPFAAGRPVIRALGILKKCSALVNGELGQLPIFKV